MPFKPSGGVIIDGWSAGLIDRLFEELGRDADLEWLMLDNTIIRAHQHAAGAPKKKGA